MHRLRKPMVAEVILEVIQANWYYDDMVKLVILHSKLHNTSAIWGRGVSECLSDALFWKMLLQTRATRWELRGTKRKLILINFLASCEKCYWRKPREIYRGTEDVLCKRIFKRPTVIKFVLKGVTEEIQEK
jgi:hypothetical protein